MSGKQSAFYCATHPWLEKEGLVKVGWSSNINRRLTDDCYVTCFSVGEWRFLFTLETKAGEEAHMIETGVLHAFQARRLHPRELVRAGSGHVQEVALAVAERLGVGATLRVAPVYPPPKPRSRKDGPEELGASQRKRVLEAVATLVVPDPEAEMASLVDELLGLGLDDSPPPRAAPPPPTPEPEPDKERPADWLSGLRAAGASLSAKVFGGAAAEPAPAPGPAEAEGLADEIEDFVMVDALERIEESLSPFDLSAAPSPLCLREYQADAVEKCLAELKVAGRAQLVIACRCGKTPVSYSVVASILAGVNDDAMPVCALYLVPGLALARQTAQKLAAYGLPWPLLLVGSDPRGVPLPGGRELSMTTDPAVVRAFLAERGRRVVISTYQSSGLVAAAPFAVTVFDEAHRVCGGDAPRPFSCALLAPATGARLFMTATPVYDSPARTPITMKDRARFGGVAFKYHLRQGITAGFVNDFRVELVVGPAGKGPVAAQEEAAAPAQLCAAMTRVNKLLVFCRNILHATRLSAALAPLAAASAEPFEVHVVHSRQSPGLAAEGLRRFAEPGVRAALLNVRMFQEGVEIPELNGVFFAAPRYSPRDVIQSVCRPLNALPGKPQSVIFLPVLHDDAAAPDDPANLARYAALIPFIDALMEEDPRLYEHLLDPEDHPYPIDLLGGDALGLVGVKRSLMLQAVRRSVRFGASTAARPVDRLLRAENIPWEIGFGELRRVVTECKRYPKTIDLIRVGKTSKANLHTLYRRYADQYRLAKAGKETALEPWQVRALEELPCWETYGLEGPYPWKTCLEFLEQWLWEHNGQMPMLCLENGGYIGLDATAMERLSGVATVVNQSDGKARKGSSDPRHGFTLAIEKQEALDKMFAQFPQHKWRKERDADNYLVEGAPKTCFQESHAQFKAYYAAHGKDGDYIQRWFPGYPHKHKRMEDPTVAKESAPLRKPVKARRNYGPKVVSKGAAPPKK